jgi:hypothetical protein
MVERRFIPFIPSPPKLPETVIAALTGPEHDRNLSPQARAANRALSRRMLKDVQDRHPKN